MRPFDLGIHGVNFAVRAVVHDGEKLYLIVYEPAFKAAALVDTATGLAQLVMPFDAGIGADTQGRTITFDEVQVLGPRAFVWWHRGAAWSHNWNESTPWVDFKSFQGMPLFRWR